MLQVYLVRHGETQWNAERRIQGQSDSPLTAKGEQQAMQYGTDLRAYNWRDRFYPSNGGGGVCQCGAAGC